MSCRDSLETYGCGTRFLHSVIAILIIFQLTLGLSMGYVTSQSGGAIAYTLHKSVGIVVLFVAILFILWRWINPRPSWPAAMKRWERYSARTVHTMLYCLLIVMPLSGWIMATAAGRAPNFFWLCKLPFPLIGRNPALANVCDELHIIFAWCTVILIVIHILAALKHHFINKDNTLIRIFKP